MGYENVSLVAGSAGIQKDRKDSSLYVLSPLSAGGNDSWNFFCSKRLSKDKTACSKYEDLVVYSTVYVSGSTSTTVLRGHTNGSFYRRRRARKL